VRLVVLLSAFSFVFHGVYFRNAFMTLALPWPKFFNLKLLAAAGTTKDRWDRILSRFRRSLWRNLWGRL